MKTQDDYRLLEARRELEFFLKRYSGLRRDPELVQAFRDIDEAVRLLRARERES